MMNSRSCLISLDTTGLVVNEGNNKSIILITNSDGSTVLSLNLKEFAIDNTDHDMKFLLNNKEIQADTAITTEELNEALA